MSVDLKLAEMLKERLDEIENNAVSKLPVGLPYDKYQQSCGYIEAIRQVRDQLLPELADLQPRVKGQGYPFHVGLFDVDPDLAVMLMLPFVLFLFELDLLNIIKCASAMDASIASHLDFTIIGVSSIDDEVNFTSLSIIQDPVITSFELC